MVWTLSCSPFYLLILSWVNPVFYTNVPPVSYPLTNENGSLNILFEREEDVSFLRLANFDTSARIKFHLQQGLWAALSLVPCECPAFGSCSHPACWPSQVHSERASQFTAKRLFWPGDLSKCLTLFQLCRGQNPWPSGRVSWISHLGDLEVTVTSTVWTVWF